MSDRHTWLSFPNWAWGISSGWRRRRPLAQCTDAPDFSVRVPLHVVPSSVPAAFTTAPGMSDREAGEDFARWQTLPVKERRHPAVSDIAFIGLSSGAGSALLRTQKSVFKIKRCGLFSDGFVAESLKTGTTENDTDPGFAGLLGLGSAAYELEISTELWRAGLLTVYKPVGLFITTGPVSAAHRSHRFGSVIFEVASDLRLDEVVALSLTHFLSAGLQSGTVEFRAQDNVFHSTRGDEAEIAAGLDKTAAALVRSAGKAAGCAHRTLHAAHYLRGRGSAWLGNDVVAPDGRIELVDFDGGLVRAPEAAGPPLRDIEISEYLASTTAYFSWKQAAPVALAAQLFNSSFLEAYGDHLNHRLDMDLLAEVVQSTEGGLAEMRALLATYD